ncbi:MAG: ABC transporter permease [Candidatus Dormiibacterota bacterium]
MSFTVTGRGFLGALRAELLKTAKRWSPWVLLIVEAVILLGLGYLFVWFIYTHPPSGSQIRGNPTTLKAALYPGGFASKAVGGSGLASVFALLLGVLLMGNEYGSATLKTLFTLRPARLETLAAKFASIVIAVAVGVLGVFLIAALASILFAAIDGQPLNNWPNVGQIVEGLLSAWLVWSWWAIFGATLSILFQQTALAIGIGLAYSLVIEDLLLNIAASVGGTFFKTLREYFPGANASAIKNAVPVVGQHGISATTTTAAIGAGQGTIVLLLYCVAALVVSGIVIVRRDVS